MEGLGSSIDVLKYGAIGVGLAILLYTGVILKQELALPNPRTAGRNLILIYMVFSLVAFAGAAFLEVKKKSMDNDEKITALIKEKEAQFSTMVKEKDEQFSTMVKEKDAKIAEIADKSKQTIASISSAAHSLDSALSSKFKAEVNQLPESSIIRILANSMCDDVRDILKGVGNTEPAQCSQ